MTDPAATVAALTADLKARAEAAFRAGSHSDAAAICQALIARGLADAEVLRLMGALDWHAGDAAAAAARFAAALALAPKDALLHVQRAAALRALGQTEAAIGHFRRALAIAPTAPMHHDLAELLRGTDALDDAARHYRAALALDPTLAEAHNGLGIVHRRQDRPDLAIAAYKTALAIAPDLAQAHNNLGIALADLGRFAEARGHFDAALAACPDYAEARFHRALLLLLLGEWRDGFAEYEARWRLPRFQAPHLGRPWWDGGRLEGRTVLLHAEQGFGDAVQFARFAADAKARGGRVVLEGPPPLVRLLRGVDGVDAVVARGAEPPPFDVQAPLMSVPRLLRIADPAALPPRHAYLAAEPDLIAAWRERLGPRRGFRIAIAWQGNPSYRADFQRSPPLAAFVPLLRLAGIEAFSIQKGHGREQLARLPADAPVVDLADGLDPAGAAFVDTAAVMTLMDAVVCSDSAPAHVAGALGMPTLVPLPAVPDWRFLLGGEGCVWYSSMRLFRQPAPGDWPSTFASLTAAVRGMMGAAAAGMGRDA